MQDAYIVTHISDGDGHVLALYTIDGTRYGRLLLVFRHPEGELSRFKKYAASTLKPGYAIGTTTVVADSLDQVQAALQREGLVPEGQTQVAVEGTTFFDEVVAQLITGTIWAE